MGDTSFSKKPTVKQRLKKIFGAVLVFLLFFFLMAYFLFPRTSLKNYVESAIRVALVQQNSLINIEIKTVKPFWLTGIELQDVSIQSLYENQRHPLKIEKFNVRLSFLPLFIGRVNFNANIKLSDGSSHVFVSVPIFSLLNGDIKKFEVETTFNHFDIESAVDQYLGVLQDSSDPNLALFIPTITSTSFGGYLNGVIHMKSKNNAQEGRVNLNFEHLYLLVNDSALSIPIQHFKQAKAEITWTGNTYQINENTTFESENFYLKPKGSVQTIGHGHASTAILNLDLLLILSGPIEKNFGFLIPQLLKCPATSMIDGVMNVKLFGPATQYVCQ